MRWHDPGATAPGSLTAARLQLHYGALVLGSAAHSMLEHAADDSHSNLGLDRAHRSLHTHPLGGPVLHLDMPTLTLVVRRAGADVAALPLSGETLASAMAWVGSQLDASIAQREYPDFPDSPIMTGGAFEAPAGEELTAIAHWFANGLEVLEALGEASMSEIRVWPHHFDVGALIAEGDDRSIGIGLSPGDELYDQPYFYCSPYPQPEAGAKLPELGVGHWHTEGFVSAIATGEELFARAVPRDAALEYGPAAVAACRSLIG